MKQKPGGVRFGTFLSANYLNIVFKGSVSTAASFGQNLSVLTTVVDFSAPTSLDGR